MVRDGDRVEIAVEAVVLDDLLELRAGDQIPCDGVVLAAGASRSTSRCSPASRPVNKGVGDEVLSGSFVVAGSGRFQATRVGPDSYAAKLATEARRFQLTRSELMDGINTILRIVTWVLIPTSALLLWSQLKATTTSTPRRGALSPASSAWCPRAWCC